jgi:hypothetical protein
LRNGAFGRFQIQTVTILKPMRQKRFRAPSEIFQRLQQNGRSRDSVHIVVAENDDFFLARVSFQQSRDRLRHIGKQKRISQSLETRRKEKLRIRRRNQPAIDQATPQDGRNTQRTRDLRRRKSRFSNRPALRNDVRGNCHLLFFLKFRRQKLAIQRVLLAIRLFHFEKERRGRERNANIAVINPLDFVLRGFVIDPTCF